MTRDDPISDWVDSRRSRPVSAEVRRTIDRAADTVHDSHQGNRRVGRALFLIGCVRLVWLLVSSLVWS